MSNIKIRAARRSDLSALTRIYNHYIEHSPATFDMTRVEEADREPWFDHYSETGRHRLLVALRDEQPVGYATSSAFRPRAAYRTSVEVSAYLDPDVRRSGIGSALYRSLFEVLEREPVHRVYAGITLPNEASLALHTRFGFAEVGRFDEVGHKFGRFWSVVWLEKKLATSRVADDGGKNP